MRRLLALVLVAVGALAVFPGPAPVGAGDPPPEELAINLLRNFEPLQFELIILEGECDPGTFEVLDVVADYEETDVPVEPVTVEHDDSDPNRVVMTLASDTRPGDLFVEALCLDGEEPITVAGVRPFATILLTKVVVGPAPADATFVVEVECTAAEIEGAAGDPFTRAAGILEEDMMGGTGVAQFEYGVEGGSDYLYFDGPGECTFTEPVNGGATSTTIDPDVIDLVAPTFFTATVTNTFAVAAEPTFTG